MQCVVAQGLRLRGGAANKKVIKRREKVLIMRNTAATKFKTAGDTAPSFNDIWERSARITFIGTRVAG